MQRKHVGRYAPSPTGDLHLGNLRTALLAWLHARLNGGEFILRMEDLDEPRSIPGSAEQILRDLEWLGIDWDGGIEYQSQRTSLYADALQTLTSRGLVYSCFCSRKDIRDAVSAPHHSTPIYPQTCIGLTEEVVTSKSVVKNPALRLKVDSESISFVDQCFGTQQQQLASEVGDFVIKRVDGLFAYQLAVVVDDLEQGITHVVRGADLLDSTGRQIFLARLLEETREDMVYCHVPLMVDHDGVRMAKRHGSESLRSVQSRGLPAQALIGGFAHGLGLIDRPSLLHAEELLEMLSVDDLLRALSASKFQQ